MSDTVIEIKSEIEVQIDKISDTAKLDYISHVQTLKEFENLYSDMYVHKNIYGNWELK